MNDHISHLDIGGARVTRVEEMAGPAFRLSTLFPDWDESIFEAHKDWLVPHYVNPEKMTALLNMHSWVLQMGGLTVLIDTCIGNDKNRMPAERWHQNQSPYLERLAEAGFRPDDIDVPICTWITWVGTPSCGMAAGSRPFPTPNTSSPARSSNISKPTPRTWTAIVSRIPSCPSSNRAGRK